MRGLLQISLALGMAVNLVSQNAPSPSTFEVVSIRVNPGPFHVLSGYKTSGPSLKIEADDALGLIMRAYDLRGYQVQLPKVAYSTHYDIAAKAEGDGTPTGQDFRRLLQTLLAERFHLKFHRERKQMPTYALVVGKNGPKFKESAADAVFSGMVGVNGRNQSVTSIKATAEMIVADIQNYLTDRPVLDQTGLTGSYDIKFEATPEYKMTDGPQPGDISIFTAVQEMLGLKLVPRKAEIEVMIVDHWEEPTEN